MSMATLMGMGIHSGNLPLKRPLGSIGLRKLLCLNISLGAKEGSFYPGVFK